MVTVRVKRNIWGNWAAFEGPQRVREFGADEWLAVDWLSERLQRGACRLSRHSDMTLAEVEAHRARLASM
jgi:hypothetical protein